VQTNNTSKHDITVGGVKTGKKMKHYAIFFGIFYFLLVNIGYSQTWFSQETIDCTVLLEKKVGNKFIPHGTGFLLYNYTKSSNYTVITCEHVLRNGSIYVLYQADSSLIAIMKKHNDKYVEIGKNAWQLDGNNLRTKVELIEGKTFVKHPILDIAGFKLDIGSKITSITGKDTTVINISKVKGIPISMIKKKENVGLGTDVYFLGFPFMIGTQEGYSIPSDSGSINSGYYCESVANPVLRSGTIGWKSSNNNEFLIDAISYGGNSGSPVFSKAGIGIKGPCLIGMVIGHLGEEIKFDKNIKPNEVKVNVVGNAGLAKCLWIDDILLVAETISKLR